MNKMREQFEKWQIEEGYTDPMYFGDYWFKDGKYILNDVQRDWEIWKASRENLVIELPIAHEGLFQDCLAFDETDVKLALEEQGVKYE